MGARTFLDKNKKEYSFYKIGKDYKFKDFLISNNKELFNLKRDEMFIWHSSGKELILNTIKFDDIYKDLNIIYKLIDIKINAVKLNINNW